MSEPHRIRLGAQGWNYPGWLGGFYPERTRAADFLRVYARAFDTVEVDSTFYAVPAAKTVRGWAERTPPGFTFALKLPQEITHELRFVGAQDVAARFYDAARELGPKLGPVLIQCGPDFAPLERDALEEFLFTLPPDIAFAIEFRQKGWINEETHALLSQRGVALALVDARWIPRKWMLKLAERPTASHAYVRWMGPDRSITDYSHVQVDGDPSVAGEVGEGVRLREQPLQRAQPGEHPVAASEAGPGPEGPGPAHGAVGTVLVCQVLRDCSSRR
jgi:uncharacterized protein YecE (DUF72 family)